MRGVMLQRLVDDCIKLAAKRDRLMQTVEQVMRVRSACNATFYKAPW